MPPVDSGAYIFRMFQSLGFAKSGTHGAEPVSWGDIRDWIVVTDTDVSPWEAEAMMRLSLDYVSAFHESKNPACPRPRREETEDEAQERRQEVDSFFRKLGKSQSRKGMKDG